MLKPIKTKTGLNLAGECGKLVRNVQDKWLIGLYETNPAILEMFRDRDKLPYRDLLPWSGEFAGKYITGAYYVYEITHSKELYDYILSFIEELLYCMDDDGYIGCYQKQCRLTGANSPTPGEIGQTWDAWSHYHIMYGLYLWYKETNTKKYFNAVEKIAGLFLKTFYITDKKLADIGSTEMNLGIVHIFTILYNETGKPEYLDFIKNLEQDIEGPGAGNYIRYAKEGYEYYQCPKPRWESLHIIMGILNMADCYKDDSYYEAASRIFYSILKTDVHNTGGFSTDEQAIGNPFENRAVELCCVIAYNALAAELYLKNGDVKIADFLERSYYNAIMGSFSPSGRWSTYNTPMEGIKQANYHYINFQSRPGSPDLNCCSANSARGLGQLSTWSFVRDEKTFYINFFEAGKFETDDGVTVDISGDYPASNKVKIKTKAAKGQIFELRIPEWSKNTAIALNGEIIHPESGGYFMFEGSAEAEITFDFTPHFIEGDKDYKGKRSIFIGPVLYGVDLSENISNLDNIPPVTDDMLKDAVLEKRADGKLLLHMKDMTLCDFYRLGQTGSAYKTWFAY